MYMIVDSYKGESKRVCSFKTLSEAKAVYMQSEKELEMNILMMPDYKGRPKGYKTEIICYKDNPEFFLKMQSADSAYQF